MDAKTISALLNKFQEYVKYAEIHTGKCLKVLRSDNGGEYISNKFASYCRQQGIVQ